MSKKNAALLAPSAAVEDREQNDNAEEWPDGFQRAEDSDVRHKRLVPQPLAEQQDEKDHQHIDDDHLDQLIGAGLLQVLHDIFHKLLGHVLRRIGLRTAEVDKAIEVEHYNFLSVPTTNNKTAENSMTLRRKNHFFYSVS